jgi:hypothetical protein
MRRVLPFIFVLFLLSSCSSYEYLTLSSDDVPKKNEKKEFVWENDTLRLTYNFHGEGGPMTITVYNKSDQPLFIYWKKSALVMNEKAISLYKSVVNISGTIDTYRAGKSQSGVSGLEASFDLPEGMDFAPPKTFVSKELVNVQQAAVPDLQIAGNIPVQKVMTRNGYKVRLRRAAYGKAQSPLCFKTYLTFMLGHNAGKEFSVEHSFYAAEILQTNDSAETSSFYGQDGDKFYTKVSQ